MELVFENAPTSKLSNLVFDLIQERGNAIDYKFWSTELADDTKQGKTYSKVELERWISSAGEQFWLTVNTHQLRLRVVKIPNCSVTVLRVNFAQDVELNFRLEEIESQYLVLLVLELMAFAKIVAAQYGVENFYCGLMPAQDEDTRLFTNGTVGPLVF